MRELTGKPESWTPREQAAVVLNALYFAREALWNCSGSDAGDVLNDPLCGMCSPTIWFDDDGCPVATPINEAFCRPMQDRLAILRSSTFAQWLESRGASNVREFVQRIQIELEKFDRLFDALSEAGQVDEGYEDELFQRRVQLEKWPPDLLGAFRAELDKFKPGTEAFRKAGWLRGPVPEQQLLDQIRELASLSLQLETFLTGDDASATLPDKTQREQQSSETSPSENDWFKDGPPPSDWHQECLIGTQKEILKWLQINDAETLHKLCVEGTNYWIVKTHRTQYQLFCRHKARFDTAKRVHDMPDSSTQLSSNPIKSG